MYRLLNSIVVREWQLNCRSIVIFNFIDSKSRLNMQNW